MRMNDGRVGSGGSVPTRLFSAFVAGALVLGGAGHGYPLLEMVIQWLALIVMASLAWRDEHVVWTAALRGLVCVWGAVTFMMVLQMVPLPPDLWKVLPGHAIAAGIDAAAGWTLWRPLSLTPDATGGALLAFLPPLASLIGCAALRSRERQDLVMIVAAIALAVALLGFLQMAAPDDSPLFPFRTAHRGLGVGLFVNRNHQACFLLAAMPLALAVVRLNKGPRRQALGLAAVVILGLGVVATVSRSGLFLLPFVVLALLIQGGVLRNRFRFGGAVLALGLAFVLVSMAPAFQQTLARFSAAGEDSRVGYWHNTLFILQDVLPWGTGVGSFSQLYASVEPLAQLQALYVEHAHNDYLEWLVEMGLPGALLLLALLATAAAGYWQTLRRHRDDPARLALAHAALASLLVLMACSVTDFPLRMPALGVLGGMCFALIVPSSATARKVRARDAAGMWLAGGVALLLAIPVGQWGLGQQAFRSGNSDLAVRLSPWLARAWSVRASERQDAGDGGAALDAATRALRIEPMDPASVRNVGWARLSKGDEVGGTAIMLAAAQLGWRDPVVQAWLAEQGVAHAQYDVAVHGLDALLRVGVPPDRSFALLRSLALTPAARPAVVEALAQQPGWRRGFLNLLAHDTQAQFSGIEALLIALDRAGARADENETALMRWYAADAGNFADSARLWTLAGGQGLIGHASFDILPGALPQTAAPYVWRAPPLPGTSINAEQVPGKAVVQSLTITSDGISSGPVLAQTVALTPGDYIITLAVTEQGMGNTTLPGLTLACRKTGGVAGVPSPAQSLPLTWKRDAGAQSAGTTGFSVDQACAGQDFSLFLHATQGRSVAYSISTLRIDRSMKTGANANRFSIPD